MSAFIEKEVSIVGNIYCHLLNRSLLESQLPLQLFHWRADEWPFAFLPEMGEVGTVDWHLWQPLNRLLTKDVISRLYYRHP